MNKNTEITLIVLGRRIEKLNKIRDDVRLEKEALMATIEAINRDLSAEFEENEKKERLSKNPEFPHVESKRVTHKDPLGIDSTR